MKRLIAALILSVAGIAQAETISWSMPTQNTDGSAITATGEAALKLTEIQIGTCAGTAPDFTFGTVQQTLKPLAPIITQAWNPSNGTYCLRARVQNNALEFSSFSSVMRYVKSAPKPKSITISITATVPPPP